METIFNLPYPLLGTSTDETLRNAIKAVMYLSAQLEWQALSRQPAAAFQTQSQHLCCLCGQLLTALRYEQQLHPLPRGYQRLMRDTFRGEFPI